MEEEGNWCIVRGDILFDDMTYIYENYWIKEPKNLLAKSWIVTLTELALENYIFPDDDIYRFWKLEALIPLI